MKFTKLAAATALLTMAFAAPTIANDVVNDALDSIELHLGSALTCEPVIGVSYLEDARATALTSLESVGMKEIDAEGVIQRAEQAVQRDAAKAAATLAQAPQAEANQFCLNDHARTEQAMTVAMAAVANAFH